MLDDKPTTGSIETSAAAKRRFAAESLGYNVRNENKAFRALFPQYVELWEKREEERKAKLAEAGEDNAASASGAGGEMKKEDDIMLPSGEVNDLFAFGAGIVAVFSIILLALLRFF